MDALREIILAMKPDSLLPLALGLALLGMGLIAYIAFSQKRVQHSTRNRLSINHSSEKSGYDAGHDQRTSAATAKELMPKKMMKQASDFYANSDPDNIVRIRQKLIRAGYLEPGSVGTYFIMRVVSALGLFVLTIPGLWFLKPEMPFSNQLLAAGVMGLVGYFVPHFVLNNKISHRMQEYRIGFPDFMDLMIVCADAGMSMEAAIERVSREVVNQYPALSQNLTIVTIELRAGRQLADALRSLSDRLGLEEVRSFATLLQQSKELGTSLSDTLRVFSDDMRHKRMSKAEEKAHALPAKMTVPVTMFILPVIMLIATIPVIVQLAG